MDIYPFTKHQQDILVMFLVAAIKLNADNPQSFFGVCKIILRLF